MDAEIEAMRLGLEEHPRRDPPASIVPWATRVVGGGDGRTILPTWLRWLILWQLGLICLILVIHFTGGSYEMMPVAIGTMMGGFFFSWAPCHICTSIEKLHDEWKRSPIDKALKMDWQELCLKVVSSKNNWLGIGFLIILYVFFSVNTKFFTQPEPWFGSSEATWLFALLTLMVFLVGGWGTAFLVQITLLPSKFPKDTMKFLPSPWEHHMRPLRMLSSVFFMLSIYGAMIIICCMVIALNFPNNLGQYAYYLVILVGILDLFAFLYPQIGVHEQLKKYKLEYLLKISENLDESLQSVNDDPTEENIGRFEQLAGMHDRIRALDEWPFNIQQLGTVLASVGIPMILFLAQIYITEGF